MNSAGIEISKINAKRYKEAINYLEYVSKLCQVPIDIKFRPIKSFPTEKTNRWTITVMGTKFTDDNFVIATINALDLITKAFPDKFKTKDK